VQRRCCGGGQSKGGSKRRKRKTSKGEGEQLDGVVEGYWEEKGGKSGRETGAFNYGRSRRRGEEGL
jgi:hypothetical protein